MIKIAVNTAKTWIKQNEKMEPFPDDAAYGIAVEVFDLPLAIAEQREVQEAVRSAIALLAPLEQKVVVLRFYLEMKEKDIAGILNISAGTVKKELFKARKKLSRELESWFQEAGDRCVR